MMQFNPSIVIKHLVAKKSNEVVFTEKFHYGLNVLYGSNGGGKTSIIQLLVYSLGYNIVDWKVEAGSCDFVFCEVELNNITMTFRRKINHSTKQSLQICYMELSLALETSLDNWAEYPYAISANKESFSQKIFELLGMPETKFDDNSNMTLHQILRLIYSDQSNPARFIFNHENFDSALKREIVGNHLLGLYDAELYDAKIELNKAQKKFDKLNSELKAMYTILRNSNIIEESDDIEEYLKKLNDETIALIEKIALIKANQILDYTQENKAINELSNNNIELKQQIFDIESDLSLTAYEIEDSKLFIQELEDKLDAINDSIRMKQAVSNIDFEICPSCFTVVKKSDDNSCSLCKQTEPKKQAEVNLLRMRNELQLQLKESLSLLSRKESRFSENKKILNTHNSLLKKNITEIVPTFSTINTAREKELFESYQLIGQNQEKVDTYNKLGSLYNEVNRISDEKDIEEKNIEKFEELVKEKENVAIQRETELRTLISTIMCRLLQKDTIAESNEELEDKFKSATKVDFDFASNAIIVDGQSIFSESSMFLLNNLFHLAILLASTEKEYIRFPRLLILDGIENGGMSDARSRNFQKIVKDETDTIKTKFQVLIATRSIHESLENKMYQIGNKLTSNAKSLNI
jgi:hypothetical protein